MDRRHAGDMLCSEILNLHLQSRAGRERQLTVNLEEIWSWGALFQTDEQIRPHTSLWFAGGDCEFRGQVIARTLLRGLGYFIEMRFHPSCTWSEQKYRPKHLFNPMVLLANRIFEATLNPPCFETHRDVAALRLVRGRPRLPRPEGQDLAFGAAGEHLGFQGEHQLGTFPEVTRLESVAG